MHKKNSESLKNLDASLNKEYSDIQTKELELVKVFNEKYKMNYELKDFNYMYNEEGKDQYDDEQNMHALIQNLDNNSELNSIFFILNRYLTNHSKKNLDKETKWVM